MSPRSILVALVALLLTLASLSTLNASPATAGRGAGKPATVLGLTVPSGAVSGDRVAVSGRLLKQRSGLPAKGQRVIIQERAFDSKSWNRAAATRTNGKGRYRTKMSLVDNVKLRAVYAGNNRNRGDRTPVRSVRPRQRLSVTSKLPSSIDGGEVFTLRGKATPGLQGSRVYLQRQFDSGRWGNIGSAKINKKLGYRVTGSVSDGSGELSFRTATRKTRTEEAATSKAVGIEFSGWYRLSGLSPAESPAADPASTNFSVIPRPTVDGTTYVDSYASRARANGLAGFERGNASFNLARRCTMLRSTIGLADNAGSSAAWQFVTKLDGGETNYGFLEGGQSMTISEDLTAVGILTLSNLRRITPPDSESQYADAVWAGARVQCDERPQ